MPRPPGPCVPLREEFHSEKVETRCPKWHWVEYRFSGSKDCKQAPRKTVILPPKLVGLSMSEATTISLLIDFPSLAARSWNTSSRSKSGTWFFHGIIFFWTSVHSDWLSASPELEPGKEKENINLYLLTCIYMCVYICIYIYIWFVCFWLCWVLWLLHTGFLWLCWAGAASRGLHTAPASAAAALRLWSAGSVVVAQGPRHARSSWNRDQTRVPCIGRKILNH